MNPGISIEFREVEFIGNVDDVIDEEYDCGPVIPEVIPIGKGPEKQRQIFEQ